jgi:hypothetical protein
MFLMCAYIERGIFEVPILLELRKIFKNKLEFCHSLGLLVTTQEFVTHFILFKWPNIGPR